MQPNQLENFQSVKSLKQDQDPFEHWLCPELFQYRISISSTFFSPDKLEAVKRRCEARRQSYADTIPEPHLTFQAFK